MTHQELEEAMLASVGALTRLEDEILRLKKRDYFRTYFLFLAQILICISIFFGAYTQYRTGQPLRELNRNLVEIQQKLDQIINTLGDIATRQERKAYL